MRVTFSDFAAAIIATSFLVAVFVWPYVTAWHYMDKHFSREAAHDSRPLAEGWGLARPGAPNAPSRPGNPVLPTGDKGGTMLPSSGLEDCSPALGEVVGSLQGSSPRGDLASARCPGGEPLVRVARTNAGRWAISGSIQSTTLQDGVTPRRDGDSEDSSRFGLVALTYRGDPRWEMGRGGASLEGAFGDGPSTLSADQTKALLRRGKNIGGATDGPKTGHLQTLAVAAASLCGIDPALFWSLVLRESSGRHWDAEGRVLRSSAGALGLAQVKASTAAGLGLDARDPWQNALAGSCYLRQQFDRFGTWRKALKAYVGGPNRLRTTQAHHDYAEDILLREVSAQ